MEKELLKIYKEEHIKNGMSYTEIREKYNIPRGTWDYWIRQKNNLSSDTRTYRCKDDYFDIIDSEEKAYILGFMYADGYVSNDKRIGLLISEQDSHIAEYILSKLCPDKSIKYYNHQNIKRKPQVKFRIKSVRLWNRLNELGFKVKKTQLDSDIFKHIPDVLKRHFVRGYTDGDGNLRFDHVIHNSYKYGVVWSNGSKQVLLDIQNWLLENGISTNLHKYKNKSYYYGLSTYKKKNTYLICKLLYTNCSVFLNRKKETADKIVKFCTNTELTRRSKKLLVV